MNKFIKAKDFLVLGVIAVLVFSVVLSLKASSQPQRTGSLTEPNRWTIGALNTAATVGPNSSTRVVATSTNRQYVLLTNDSAGAVYCNLSDASSTRDNGLLIAASSSYAIGAENLYIGSVQCMNPSASTTLLVTGMQ